MKKTDLPRNIRGEWIWLSRFDAKNSGRLFMRRELILDSAAPCCDFWISASYSYHLYVNGEHVGFGPASSVAGHAYADWYDISLYLEPGINTIAIFASEMNLPSYAHQKQLSGVWCQLNIDDMPVLWTNEEWKVYPASDYETGKARRHTGMEFTEKFCFGNYPDGWDGAGFDDHAWCSPDRRRDVREPSLILHAYPCKNCEISDPFSLDGAVRGHFKPETETTHVSFVSLSANPPGRYAAESFVHLGYGLDVSAVIASDMPFVFILNEELVSSNGLNHIGEKRQGPLVHAAYGDKPVFTAELHLKKGWNRFLFVQDTEADGMGFMIQFPALKKGTLTFLRENHEKALHGWKLAGPLKMPLALTTASLHLRELETIPFTPIGDNINDTSFWLDSCLFTVDGNVPKVVGNDDGISLRENEFVIYDLASLQFGFPLIDLLGCDGDIVDITCGTEIRDSKVVSVSSTLGRNTDTAVLSGKMNRYMRLEPRGARFIMVSVRKTSASVQIPSAGFATFQRPNADDESDFSCSDPAFHEIWKTALSALNQSSGLSFMDNPCGKRSQSMPESFIQSLASFYLLGDTSLSEKALREFTFAQTENGAFPDIATSELCSYRIDNALLWPVWLDYHWSTGGDAAFRDKMLPHLDALLDYCFSIVGENGLLFSKSESGGTHLCCALNSLYCRALLSAAHVYEAAEKKERAVDARKQAAKNAEVLCSLLYKKENGLFANSITDGKISDKHSIHANFLALISGVAPADSFEKIVKHFIPSSSELAKTEEDSRFYIFLLETLFSFGKQDFALKLIREIYREKSPALNWKLDAQNAAGGFKNKNEDHVGSIIPAYFIMRELLGVRSAVPGMSQIYFNPAYQTVSSAKGKISTPYGTISIEWTYKNGELDVTADSNYPLDIAPEFPQKLFENCTFHLGKSVSVLDPTTNS